MHPCCVPTDIDIRYDTQDWAVDKPARIAYVLSMSILSKPYFHDEAAAIEFVESVLWPDGPVCYHCGKSDWVYPLKGIRGRSKVDKETGEIIHGKERLGLRKCGHCKGQFTVRMGTVFESSHVPLHKWVQAIHLLCSSKKGFSAHQLHRVLECHYRTALFMYHRVREAMRSGELAPFGGGGGAVEVDEAYWGIDPDAPVGKKRNLRNMNRVLTMIDRTTGQARSMVVPEFTIETVTEILEENISKEARLLTDESSVYKTPGKAFASHDSVKHGVHEYVKRRKPWVHVNTVESYFGLFKRGMRGIYQHCSKRHLHRYVAEFDFRYNNRVALGVDDEARAVKALQGAKGKRLYYKQPA
jgi:transposase-like protein